MTENNAKRVLICDCEGTMTLDGNAIGKACGQRIQGRVNTQLCRSQIENFEAALRDEAPLLVCCTQEAPIFLEAAEGVEGAPSLSFTNIRERAGWSKAGQDEPRSLTPKIAALIAEAALDLAGTTTVSLQSSGVLLVIGSDETAIDAAKQLADRLDVTVLLTGKAADVIPPAVNDVPILRGRIRHAEGHFGAFRVVLDGHAFAEPSSRGALQFGNARKEGVSECDLILDLRGETPLFRAPEKRDGYFCPDPANPAAVHEALFKLADMVGEYEKPRYVDYDAAICAHARSGITGCTRCLDNCPTGAIAPAGDKVEIDPYVCAGCGACASVCPTGAATYALPAGEGIYQRLRALLGTYAKAGGKAPVLLVHDAAHGTEMIDLMARLGDGLPRYVLPFAVNETTQVGLDFMFSALAYGAAQVTLLIDHRKADEAEGLAGEVAIADTVLRGLGYGRGRVAIADERDPDRLNSRLRGLDVPRPVAEAASYRAMGRKRAIMNLALAHLHKHASESVDEIALPKGAPFGAVEVDVEGCTLCLSCVGACPTGALRDNPDKPQLSFVEDSCVQCGLCRNTCPESVISLTPRLSFAEAARQAQVVKEEEPFECIRCGKPFGTRASIERMVGKLQTHPMFAEGDRIDMLRMCDDCRVITQTESTDHPFAMGERPRTRTTEDYLREREEMREQAKADMREKGIDPEADGEA